MSDLALERALWRRGFACVAGVDEVGRGPLAGPLVVAAVILPILWQPELPIDDSKRMSVPARDAASSLLRRQALSWRIVAVSAQEIDRINILAATMLGMRKAVDKLRPAPDYVLVDGNRMPSLAQPGEAVVKGDQRSLSIAAASVLAKVARDRMMSAYARRYPHWGFERHKGYGTLMHRQAMARHGRCPIHRASFTAKEPM